MPPLASRFVVTLHFFSPQDREGFAAIRQTMAGYLQHNCNGYSEGESEGDEIPEGGKTNDEDYGAANGEENPYETSADGELVHVDAGMTTFWHNPTSW